MYVIQKFAEGLICVCHFGTEFSDGNPCFDFNPYYSPAAHHLNRPTKGHGKMRECLPGERRPSTSVPVFVLR